MLLLRDHNTYCRSETLRYLTTMMAEHGISLLILLYLWIFLRIDSRLITIKRSLCFLNHHNFSELFEVFTTKWNRPMIIIWKVISIFTKNHAILLLDVRQALLLFFLIFRTPFWTYIPNLICFSFCTFCTFLKRPFSVTNFIRISNMFRRFHSNSIISIDFIIINILVSWCWNIKKVLCAFFKDLLELFFLIQSKTHRSGFMLALFYLR